MTESTRSQRETIGAPSGGMDAIAQSLARGGMVTVSHGVHLESLPVGGLTIGEIRRRFADRFDIDPLARAEIDGRSAGEDLQVRPGQMLTFANRAGEKGAFQHAAA